MCFCIFTLVFTYIMSVRYHQSPPLSDGAVMEMGVSLRAAGLQTLLIATSCASDHDNNKGVASFQTHPHICRDFFINHLLSSTLSMPRLWIIIHFTARCSLSL